MGSGANSAVSSEANSEASATNRSEAGELLGDAISGGATAGVWTEGFRSLRIERGGGVGARGRCGDTGALTSDDVLGVPLVEKPTGVSGDGGSTSA